MTHSDVIRELTRVGEAAQRVARSASEPALAERLDAAITAIVEELNQTGFERSYWRDLIADRRLDVIRGLAKRLTQMRRNYIETARMAERALCEQHGLTAEEHRIGPNSFGGCRG